MPIFGTLDYGRRKGRFKSWLRTLVNNRTKNLARNRRERAAESRGLRGLEASELKGARPLEKGLLVLVGDKSLILQQTKDLPLPKPVEMTAGGKEKR